MKLHVTHDDRYRLTHFYIFSITDDEKHDFECNEITIDIHLSTFLDFNRAFRRVERGFAEGQWASERYLLERGFAEGRLAVERDLQEQGFAEGRLAVERDLQEQGFAEGRLAVERVLQEQGFAEGRLAVERIFAGTVFWSFLTLFIIIFFCLFCRALCVKLSVVGFLHNNCCGITSFYNIKTNRLCTHIIGLCSRSRRNFSIYWSIL